MQKIFLSALFLILANISIAQTTEPVVDRKGFTFGCSIGAGILTMESNDTTNTSLTSTVPNLRIGYAVNSNFVLQILLPGSTYQRNGSTRGFEGLLVTGQYWVKEKWWLLGGTGITVDAPAFWTVKDPAQANFYFGFPALTFATGFELWRKKNFVMDVQYRIFAGEVKSESGKIGGLSNMISIGFNWY